MKRFGKKYLPLGLLWLAFCMLQVHIMVGCCYVHHDHTHHAAADSSHAEGTFPEIFELDTWAADEFACDRTADHFCDRSPADNNEEGEFCSLFLLTDSQKQQSKISHLIITLALCPGPDIIPTVEYGNMASNDQPILLSENPLYLRYRSLLI